MTNPKHPDEGRPLPMPRAEERTPAVWHTPPTQNRGVESDGDDFQILAQYLRILWARRWTLAGCVVLGGLMALGFSLSRTPLYQATTFLEIQDFREPLATSLMGADSTLITRIQLLGSREMRERTVSSLASSPAPEMIEVREPLGWLRGVLGLASPLDSYSWLESIGVAAQMLEVAETERDSRIVSIRSSAPNPQAASAFVNTLAQEYLKRAQEERWEVYDESSEWLTEAAEEQKTRLEESEQALAAFARSAGLVVTSDANLTEESLIQMQQVLSSAVDERIRAEAIYSASLSSPAAALPGVLASGEMSSYQIQLADLRRELALLSTTLTPAHFRVREIQNQINELEAVRETERGNIIKGYQVAYETALEREQQIQRNFQNQSRLYSDQSEAIIQFNVLKREVETNSALYETMLGAGKQASVASAMQPSGARIVDPARPSNAPYTPAILFNLALGIFGGLGVSSAFVTIRSRTDTRIQAPGTLTPYLHVRELGVIPSSSMDPAVKALTRRSNPSLSSETSAVGRILFRASGETMDPEESLELVTFAQKPSVFAEAFRATMTSILYSAANGERPKVLLVSSPSPKEGKSTVVSNLAIALAEIEQRVLLVDGDMRLPRIHAIFDVPNTFGLSDVLHERTPIESYPEEGLVRKTRIPNLYVLPAGPARPNVSPMLHSGRMQELSSRLRGMFDLVLIDAAPVLSVPDARILARNADAVILVLRAHRTTEEAAFAAAKCFAEDGTRILGTILNDWNPKTSGYGHYGQGYYEAYQSHYHDA